jgi:hypothetical protein
VVGIYKSSTIPSVSRSTDFTHGTAIVLIWLVAEVTATIMAASIPLFRPLLRHLSGTSSTRDGYGMSRITNRSRNGWGGHSRFSSRADVQSDPNHEYGSDKDTIALNTKIVCKTNITVEYDGYSADAERGH